MHLQGRLLDDPEIVNAISGALSGETRISIEQSHSHNGMQLGEHHCCLQPRCIMVHVCVPLLNVSQHYEYPHAQHLYNTDV